MRIIVMGTGPFAVPSAEGLWAAGHDIALVVTRPIASPQPKKQPDRPMADWAASHGISLYEPKTINATEVIEHLRAFRADLFFVCDYGQILSRDCLSASRLGGVNLHGSILPRHRGAAPVQWSLLAGDRQAGVTAIWMTPKLDGGPALAMRNTEILPDETAGGLEPRLAELGVDATLDAVQQLQAWDGNSPLGQIQDSALVTRAPRFHKSQGQLDFRLPADYLVRLIRACQPWPGTYAELHWSSLKRERVLVRSARSLAQGSLQTTELPVGAAPGSVKMATCRQLGLHWPEEWHHLLCVQALDGWVLINRVQLSGKREMSVAEFGRGHPLNSESCFLLPAQPAVQLVP